MKTKCFTLLLALCAAIFLSSCTKSQEIKIFQINIWHATDAVEGGFDALVDEIVSLDPDLVTLNEMKTDNRPELIAQLIEALGKRGKTYYGEDTAVHFGLISKYPISKLHLIDGKALKAYIPIGDKNVVLYATHLDYLHCAYYLPRAYTSSTWERMEAPIMDVDSILADNLASERDEQIAAVITDAKQEKVEGNFVFLCGDFNEPSHLDWQADTKDIREHQGLEINWNTSVSLYDDGFVDAYRVKYPDPVTHPGFTYPSANDRVDVKQLAWGPEADERDRIDFIYYVPNPKLILKDIRIVGPSQTILHGQPAESDSQDPFILPQGAWHTDHKALLATFVLK